MGFGGSAWKLMRIAIGEVWNTCSTFVLEFLEFNLLYFYLC